MVQGGSVMKWLEWRGSFGEIKKPATLELLGERNGIGIIDATDMNGRLF